ncbi:MAG: M55 family metallopeptidase [Pseudomonadota bacterium]
MKIYISADIEGVAGVVSPAQTLQSGFEYEAARRWMTLELCAACEGAFEAGAAEIIVSDSHGNGQNLLLDLLPDKVRVVRNWPRPLGMMQGVETDGIAGAFLLGYHTGAHHQTGVLAHTSAGLLFTEIRLNGAPASETMISAALAGAFSVPILFASGDQPYVVHALDLLGEQISTVETKTPTGRYSADTLTPKAACAKIRQAAADAVNNINTAKPYALEAPIVFEADFQRHLPAELLDYLPCVDRIGSHTIRHEAPDMIAISKFLSFITAIQFDEQLP